MITMRRATVDDIEAIAHVYISSWQYAYRGIVPDAYLNELSEERLIQRRKGTVKEYVFELDGQVIGVSYFCRARDEGTPENVAEMVTIYFLPQYIALGYGSQFMEWILERLREQGYAACIVWTLEDNHRARRAYEKVGFKNTGDMKTRNIGGRDLHEVCYQLML